MAVILLLGSDLIFIIESKEYSSMEFFPILCKFLLYINDFTQASKMFSMRLYADDTSLTVSGKNIDDLLYQINLE